MVQVVNGDRDTPIIERGRVADNIWSRFRGLIGVRHLPKGDGLLIKPCKGVHCMFMSIPIDVVYVGKDDVVVAIDEGMRPWRVGRVYRKSYYVLELPVGTVQETDTRIGDRLRVLSV